MSKSNHTPRLFCLPSHLFLLQKMSSSESHPSFSPGRDVISMLAGESSSAVKDYMLPDKSKWKVEQKGVWAVLVNYLLNSIYKDCCPVLTFLARMTLRRCVCTAGQTCSNLRSSCWYSLCYTLAASQIPSGEETWINPWEKARLYRICKATRVPWSWRSEDQAVTCLPQYTYCIMLVAKALDNNLFYLNWTREGKRCKELVGI